MTRNPVIAIVCLCVCLVPARAIACAGHFSLNPDDYGFLGGAMIRLAGLAPPAPTFDLEYPAMARPVLGERSTIVVKYARPFFSDNVSITVTGSKNVQLFQESFALDNRSGTLDIPYQLNRSGYDTISLTLSGEHKGKTVRQIGRIYVRAIVKTPKQGLQISER